MDVGAGLLELLALVGATAVLLAREVAVLAGLLLAGAELRVDVGFVLVVVGRVGVAVVVGVGATTVGGLDDVRVVVTAFGVLEVVGVSLLLVVDDATLVVGVEVEVTVTGGTEVVVVLEV